VSTTLAIKHMNYEAGTGVNILRHIESVFADFGIHNPSATINMVTDRDANMKSAFSGYTRINCILHLINNVLKATTRDSSNLQTIIDKCSKLVKYIKKSGSQHNMDTSLKPYVKTRFNTYFIMVRSICENWDPITTHLRNIRKLELINGLDIHLLKSIETLYEYFSMVSKVLEGSSYPTLHLVIPHVSMLETHCVPSSDDTAIIAEIKPLLSKHIKEIITPNLDIIHKIAIFLFPPANKLVLFSTNERNDIWAEVKRNMIAIEENLPAEPDISPPTHTSPLGLFCNTNNLPINTTERELEKYKMETVYFDESSFDLMQWWELHKTEYPILYTYARKVLSTPASSCASEQNFSRAGAIVSSLTTQLGKENVNDMLVVSSFSHRRPLDINGIII
jgi:hypothetical protein